MSSKSSGTKKQIVTDSKNKAALDRAGSIQADKTLNSLSALGLEIQKTLGNVGASFIEKLDELRAVDTSIELKRAEMEELHGKDSILMTLDELRSQHQQTLQKFADEVATRRETQEELDRVAQEQRDREEDQYRYNLARDRQADEHNWQEQLRIRQRDEKIRQENFDKSLAARDEELKKKEADYQAALDKAARFDGEVTKAVAERVAIITDALKKDHEHVTQLANIQHQAQVDGLNTKLAGLEKALVERDATIADLRAQLMAAQQSQIQLAKDAVNAANQKTATAEAMSLMTNIGGGNGARTTRS